MENTQHKVLVVEDDPLLSDSLKAEFGPAGFEVHTAVNGEEGFEKALSVKPSIIILDLLMPESGGMDMLAKLKNDPWGKTVHVMVLTNLSGVEETDEIEKMENCTYLVKSDFGLDQILTKVKEILKISQ